MHAPLRPRARWLLGCAAMAAWACAAPVGEREDPDSVEPVAESSEALSTPTLKAATFSMWANLNRDRSTSAHFVACPGQKFLFNFTMKNRGSAVWRDVKGRGDNVGSDVFLETANGMTDGLTGKVRYSLNKNANDFCRGGRKGKNCASAPGCNKTRSVKGGMKGKAPLKSGVYKTRWRLRDYSKAWGANSKGFGPKVEMRVRVQNCSAPWCGCRVQCGNGEIQDVTANVQTDAICVSVGESLCGGSGLASHLYVRCPDGSGGATGTGGAGNGGEGWGGGAGVGPPGGWAGNPGDEDEDDPPGSWYFEEDDGTSGAAGAGAGGTGGGGATGTGADGGTGAWDDEPDDPDYTPSGFNGIDEDAERGSVIEERASGCALGRSQRAGAASLSLLVGALLLLRRRRSKRDQHGAGSTRA